MSEDLYNSKYKDKLELSYKVVTFCRLPHSSPLNIFVCGLLLFNICGVYGIMKECIGNLVRVRLSSI